eukprot:m.757353 g.757353  ORF g.757353 m.757353 type:complete len:93 (+) comp23187_c0_seq25:1500-1778(+)
MVWCSPTRPSTGASTTTLTVPLEAMEAATEMRPCGVDVVAAISPSTQFVPRHHYITVGLDNAVIYSVPSKNPQSTRQGNANKWVTDSAKLTF